jgi:hypothetical protein
MTRLVLLLLVGCTRNVVELDIDAPPSKPPDQRGPFDSGVHPIDAAPTLCDLARDHSDFAWIEAALGRALGPPPPDGWMPLRAPLLCDEISQAIERWIVAGAH